MTCLDLYVTSLLQLGPDYKNVTCTLKYCNRDYASGCRHVTKAKAAGLCITYASSSSKLHKSEGLKHAFSNNTSSIERTDKHYATVSIQA